MERWGQYFKPAGMNQVTGDPNTTKTVAKASDDESFDEPAPSKQESSTASSTSSSKAEDILAMIRNRQK